MAADVIPANRASILLHGKDLPAISEAVMKKILFLPFFPQDNHDSPSGSEQQVVSKNTISVETLLRLPQNEFWSHALYDKSLHKFLDTFLRFCARRHDAGTSTIPSSTRSSRDRLAELVFRVLFRLASISESKVAKLDADFWAEVVYEYYIFDIPLLMDICVVYGEGNPALTSSLLEKVMTQQPNYQNDMKDALAVVVEALMGLSSKTIDSKPHQLQDLAVYSQDVAVTLSSFIKAYRPAGIVLVELGGVHALGSCFDDVVPKLMSVCPISQLKKIRASLLTCATESLEVCFSSPTEEKVIPCIVQDLEKCLLSQTNGNSMFVAMLNRSYPLFNKLDAVASKNPSLSPAVTKLREASVVNVESAYASSEHVVQAHESGNFSGQLSTMSDTEREVLVAQAQEILGIFPDYGLGFVVACLQHFSGNSESVIDALLSANIPKELQGIPVASSIDELSKPLHDSTDYKGKKKEPSLLNERRNVFDGDEFDVLQRDVIDSGKVHMKNMKREKQEDVLDDKNGIDVLARYEALLEAERIAAEEAAERGEEIQLAFLDDGEYNDEYDDSFEEFMQLGMNRSDAEVDAPSRGVQLLRKVPNETEAGLDDEGDGASDEEGNPTDGGRSGTERLNGRNEKNQPQQGQSKENTRKIQQKHDRQKASRANHNRKSQHDKKFNRSVGGV